MIDSNDQAELLMPISDDEFVNGSKFLDDEKVTKIGNLPEAITEVDDGKDYLE